MMPKAARTVQVGWNEHLTRRDNPYKAILDKNYEKDRTMILIDARLMSYASFHTRRLSAPDGTDTSVTHGLIEQIQGLCEAANTRRWMLVWDGVPSYRRRLFKGYKIRQDRDRTPEEAQQHKELVRSMEAAHQVSRLLNWPSVRMSEVEADDLIGVLSGVFMRHGVMKGELDQIMLVTDDKDYYQLIVDDKCVVYRHRMSEVVDAKMLKEMYGLTPSQYIDYKALMGEPETGDNIPKAAKVGDITARKLISVHGDITNLHQHLSKMSKVKNGLKRAVDAGLYNGQDITARAYLLSRILREPTELIVCYPGNFSKAKSEWALVRRGAGDAMSIQKIASLHQMVQFKSKYAFDSFDPQRWARLAGYRIGL